MLWSSSIAFSNELCNVRGLSGLDFFFEISEEGGIKVLELIDGVLRHHLVVRQYR
jgi:hypothetical protein